MIMWMNTMSGEFAFAFYVMYRENAKKNMLQSKIPLWNLHKNFLSLLAQCCLPIRLLVAYNSEIQYTLNWA